VEYFECIIVYMVQCHTNDYFHGSSIRRQLNQSFYIIIYFK